MHDCNKVINLCISDGEVMGTTRGDVYKSKLGGYEVSELVSSYGSFDGPNDGDSEVVVPV